MALAIDGWAMSRSFVLGAVSAFAVSSSAFAADIYPGDSGSLKDAPAVYSVATWSGFYVGGHVGGLHREDSDVSFEDEVNKKKHQRHDKFRGDIEDFSIDEDSDEWELIGGVHAGYNIQRYGSPIVIGVEGDIDFAENVEYLASIRGRLGYATSSTLLYVTAGVAFASFDDDLDVTYEGKENKVSLFDEDSGDDSETGFVVGGGAEFKVRHNVSFGVEGLYYGFDRDDKTVTFVDKDHINNKNDDDFRTFTSEGEDELWQVRARVSYHFNRDDHTPLK